jgi:hypothetical protein
VSRACLFFATPERDSNGPSRSRVGCCKNPHGLDQDAASGGIVRGTFRGVHRIQMGAEHDWRFRGFGAREVGDHVESELRSARLIHHIDVSA